MAAREVMQGVTFDGLLAGSEVPTFTTAVKAAADIAAHALVTKGEDGTFTPTAKAGKAFGIAKDAAKNGEALTVYTGGFFNREAVKAADGDTVMAHEEELRGLGIRLSSLK